MASKVIYKLKTSPEDINFRFFKQVIMNFLKIPFKFNKIRLLWYKNTKRKIKT